LEDDKSRKQHVLFSGWGNSKRKSQKCRPATRIKAKTEERAGKEYQRSCAKVAGAEDANNERKSKEGFGGGPRAFVAIEGGKTREAI